MELQTVVGNGSKCQAVGTEESLVSFLAPTLSRRTNNRLGTLGCFLRIHSEGKACPKCLELRFNQVIALPFRALFIKGKTGTDSRWPKNGDSKKVQSPH